MPCLVRFIISSWFLKLNYPLFFFFLLFLFLIENGWHEIRGFCFSNFCFLGASRKKNCFVGAAKQSGRLLKSDYVFSMATEWNERKRGIRIERERGLRWMVGTGLQDLSCFRNSLPFFGFAVLTECDIMRSLFKKLR